MARRQQLVSGIRRHAIPLAGVEAGRGFADLEALKTIIGGARIVALGEATHGTREFFQLKHRLLEFLVTEMGFTVFALEANWPESVAVNDYVLHGRGDPAQVLAGLRFWTWNTREVLDLILWMRQYNENIRHTSKTKFAGFDAQFTSLAATALQRYLRRVDPVFAAQVRPRLVQFEQEDRDYSRLSAADVAARCSAVRDLAARLRRKEVAYVARSSAREWRLACQHARILRQVHGQRRAGTEDRSRYMLRDEAMAENVAWLLENEGPRSKMVVWAHNAHVARDARGIFDGTVVSMGMRLARMFDREMVVVGFAFGEGAFQAIVTEEGGRRPIRDVAIGPPRPETFDGTLAQTGIPVFILDLRETDADVATWLREPQVSREVGAFFETQDDMCKTIVPSARYDVLAFIARTTPARPNS